MPLFEFQGPNGETFEVEAPDENSALQALQSQAPPAPKAPVPEVQTPDGAPLPQAPTSAPPQPVGATGPVQAAGDIVRLMAEGSTLGFADKVTAALTAPNQQRANLGNLGDLIDKFKQEFGRVPTGPEIQQLQRGALQQPNVPYEQELTRQRALTQDARDRSGNAGVITELGSAIMAPLKLAGAGLTTTKLLPKTASTGLKTAAISADAAALSAANAAGHDDDVLTGAITGAVMGPVGVAAGSAITGGAKKAAGLFNKTPKVVSSTRLKKAKDSIYRAFDKLDVQYNKNSFKGLVDDITNTLNKEHVDPNLHRGTNSVMKVLKDRLKTPINNPSSGGFPTVPGEGPVAGITGNSPTIQELERIRQMAFERTKHGQHGDPRFGRIIRGKIADFIKNAKPTDVISGDHKAGARIISRARNLNVRTEKLGAVDKAVGKAKRKADSLGNDVGKNIKSRLLTMVEKGDQHFTKDEAVALEKIIRGTKSANIAQFVGRFSPTSGVLPAISHAVGAGFNPYISLPIAAAGMTGKFVANKSAVTGVEKLRRMIITGGIKSKSIPPQNAAQRFAEKKRDATIRALLAGTIGATNQVNN